MIVPSILPLSRLPPSVDSPDQRHGEDHGEALDNHYGHSPLNAAGGAA